MSQALKTTGDRGLDSEIDRLWAEIARLKGATAPVTQAPSVEAIYQTIIQQGGGGGVAGVSSITPTGGTPVQGDVVLAAGTNITLTETGRTITITASGAGGSGIPVVDVALRDYAGGTYTIPTPSSDCIVVVKNATIPNTLFNTGFSLNVSAPTGWTYESWNYGTYLGIAYSEAIGVFLDVSAHQAYILWIFRQSMFNSANLWQDVINGRLGTVPPLASYVTYGDVTLVDYDLQIDGEVIMLDDISGAAIASGASWMLPTVGPV